MLRPLASIPLPRLDLATHLRYDLNLRALENSIDIMLESDLKARFAASGHIQHFALNLDMAPSPAWLE